MLDASQWTSGFVTEVLHLTYFDCNLSEDRKLVRENTSDKPTLSTTEQNHELNSYRTY